MRLFTPARQPSGSFRIGAVVRTVGLLPFVLLAACAPHLRFTAGVLQPARCGTAYRAQVDVERQETPVSSVTLMDGALPPGLSITHDGGSFTLSGTPTVAGRYHATVYVSCFGTNFPGQTANDVIELLVRP